jgi:hypothetical protein
VPRRVGKKEGSTSVNPFWINIAGAKNEQNICRGREPTGDRVRCCSTGKSVNQEVLHAFGSPPNSVESHFTGCPSISTIFHFEAQASSGLVDDILKC